MTVKPPTSSSSGARAAAPIDPIGMTIPGVPMSPPASERVPASMAFGETLAGSVGPAHLPLTPAAPSQRPTVISPPPVMATPRPSPAIKATMVSPAPTSPARAATMVSGTPSVSSASGTSGAVGLRGVSGASEVGAANGVIDVGHGEGDLREVSSYSAPTVRRPPTTDVLEQASPNRAVTSEILQTGDVVGAWPAGPRGAGDTGETGGSGVPGRSTTGSGAMSTRGPSSITLPPNLPMDVTISDIATSVLPSIQVHDDHAEIVNDGRPRYTRVKALGEGGVGAVDLVYDNDIARKVALKRLKGTTRTPTNLARFIEEIQAVGSLEHPGIAPIHDVGLDEHGYFFTMKFVEGETLETIIDELRAKKPEHERRFSMDARVAIFMQILRTMQFAHATGYIHRDLKPANVIVGRYGEVLVMDWGLAKRTRRDLAPTMSPEELEKLLQSGGLLATPTDGDAPRERAFETRTGTLLGSPGYMSPEQARGLNDQLDERSDVYSLSVLFFELLSLRFYLDHQKDVNGVLRAIVSEEPVSAIGMHHKYGIPPEYTFFIRKGIEKDPAQRFQSVAEMSEALQQVLDGDVPVQCPCTGLKRAGSTYGDFIDRHPIGGIVGAVAIGGLSLFGAVQLVLTVARMLG